jgi:hypothetical protein
MGVVPSIVLYALLAAASPLALASTLVVLRSGRGRANGSAFAVGFLLGGTCTCLLAVAVGSFATPEHKSGHDTIAALLALVFGALLLAAAWQLRSPRPHQTGTSPRTKALLERLGRLRPATALTIGTLLGVGGPKRLTITLLVAATISLAGVGWPARLALAATYVLVGGLLVWVPVAVYLVVGKRADAWMARAEAWLTANQRQLAFASTLVLGVLLIGEAVVRLL